MDRSYSYHPSPFGLPVYPVDPTRKTRRSASADRQPPLVKEPGRKVVQIPVQFVGSDSDRRLESALKIQKVFRGFLVRKSVRKIKDIKSQVDEVEVELSRNEVVEVIRGNEMERLRMSESLMNLLLKLDGIRGIDLGIRVCRKGVTRKAIALQDKIDAICAAKSEGNSDEKMETGNQELEDGVHAPELVGIERSAENGAAAELDGSGFGNSEDSEYLGEDSREESRGLNHVPQEREKMDVVMDFVNNEGSDAMVSSEVSPSEETCIETGISENIDLDEDNVDNVEEMLVQSNGKDEIKGESKDDDDAGNLKFSANSDHLGEISGDLREEFEGGNNVEVEDETMEVERSHLDAEIIDVPVTSVVEVSLETCPVKEAPNNLDSDEDNAEPEIVKEMLVESNAKHGIIEWKKMEGEGDASRRNGEILVDSGDVEEILGDSKVEWEGGSSVEEQDKTMDVEGNVEDTRKCKMLERMMEDNKRAMQMITQLYDRKEMQLQMLDALANRVELLEKAYVCDKLRNRRKKNKYAPYSYRVLDNVILVFCLSLFGVKILFHSFDFRK